MTEKADTAMRILLFNLSVYGSLLLCCVDYHNELEKERVV